MKRPADAPRKDCKHGLDDRWCAICINVRPVRSVRVPLDDQCSNHKCKRRARHQTGPVQLCEPHQIELEAVFAFEYNPQPFNYKPTEHFVYFVRIDDKIKIGHSKRVAARVRSFAAYGQEVEVLAIQWGDRALEKRLHRRFEHLQSEVGLSREMFEPADDLLDYIRSERKCAYCQRTCLSDRAVCDVHQDRELEGEHIIGWTTAHADTTPAPVSPTTSKPNT